MVPYRGGALPEPQVALSWVGTSCPGCEPALPHLLRLQRSTDLGRLGFQFCLLSSLGLAPRLGNVGRDASSWNHVVVKQDICQVLLVIPGTQGAVRCGGRGGVKGERYREGTQPREMQSLALGSGAA